MKQEPIVMERTFQAPVQKVWNAITDKNQMKKWYFDLKEFELEVGFEFQFTGGTPEKSFVHLCKVIEVIKDAKLGYSWSYKRYPGNSFVTFEIFPEGDSTRVKLTHEGLESFPVFPEFAKENFVAGWNHIIGVSLKDFLEK